MYIKNSMGPRTVPWGTPERTGWEEDCVPSKTTLCLGQGHRRTGPTSIWGVKLSFARMVNTTCLSRSPARGKK